MTDDTTQEIMEATFRALSEHGYASLRMQDIADESTKSKAALHYHYDSKHDLLLAFLRYLHEQFRRRLEEEDDADDDPAARLTTFIERRLTPRSRATRQEFQTAVLEIKAQAPYDEEYRERLARLDELMHDHVQSILEDGIESGAFRRDLDPDEVAEFFVTAIHGAQTRHVSVDYPIEKSRQLLLAYVERNVLAANRSEEVDE